MGFLSLSVVFPDIQAIERAIQTSDLGLTPNNDGKLIRLNIPQLTAVSHPPPPPPLPSPAYYSGPSFAHQSHRRCSRLAFKTASVLWEMGSRKGIEGDLLQLNPPDLSYGDLVIFPWGRPKLRKSYTS